jgi:ABC-type amino acid transport substrate-binding protein
MKSTLLYLSFALLSFSSLADDKLLTFSYWSEAGPPFVFLADNQLKNIERGLIKDLAGLISGRMQASPRFVDIPVKRMESQLINGEIDLNCITNPIWKQAPDQYHWSPALFKGADRFLVKSANKNNLNTLSDLKGKSLAVYKGYTYHPDIMKMIENGDINAVKVSGIDQGIKLLLLDRIDALIDFDILLDYKIKNAYSESLVLANLIAESYDLYCAYSKKIKFEKALLDKVFTDLIAQGEIAKMLKRYK